MDGFTENQITYLEKKGNFLHINMIKTDEWMAISHELSTMNAIFHNMFNSTSMTMWVLL
jgi:hypothetical protein